MRKLNYQHTVYACFAGYIVQAVVNNFVPLLFITFSREFSIPLEKMTFLVTFNFAVQLIVDLASAWFVDRIGYRISLVAAHLLAAAGLAMLTFLPGLTGDPFAGLLCSVMVYAVGGGLLEVLVSPVVESCPTQNKEKTMSLLHSFYCWGHVGVVLVSTVFFRFAGTSCWRILCLAWTVIPLLNLLLFTAVPLAPITGDGEAGLSASGLFRMGIFWLFMLMMLCAGASEQAVSQWASALAEKEFGISKTTGDLAGPMLFAVFMGSSRAFYGKFGDRINLGNFMRISVCLCIISYLIVAFVPVPAFALAGCALCGLSVGILWPGTFSMAAASVRRGGTAMFAFLALAGDVGCSVGPTVSGLASGFFGGNLRLGILCAVIFPILMLASTFVRRNSADSHSDKK